MGRGERKAAFQRIYERDREMINERLDALLPAAGEHPESLHEAMRYSTLSAGKRLRGILCLAAHRLFGNPQPDAVLDAACALEFLHTYTLIHDDLPALDDDELRRGNPTCHVVFGEAVALLAGDALQALAFETLVGCCAEQEAVNKCVRLLARTAGSCFLIGGQVADLEGEGRAATEEAVSFIHSRKTAELITASLEIGAILARAPDVHVKELEHLGRNAGLAFQIVDDLLDLEGSEKIVGKGLRKDAKRGKMTHPACYGSLRSREIAGELIRESIDGIGRIGNGGYLQQLFELILERVS
jgi:geranylgeranyl diphosphate synthase type II